MPLPSEGNIWIFTFPSMMLPEHWLEGGEHVYWPKWCSAAKNVKKYPGFVKINLCDFQNIICSCVYPTDVVCGYRISQASLTSGNLFSDLYSTISTWKVDRISLNNVSFTEMYAILWWKHWGWQGRFWRHRWDCPVVFSLEDSLLLTTVPNIIQPLSSGYSFMH